MRFLKDLLAKIQVLPLSPALRWGLVTGVFLLCVLAVLVALPKGKQVSQDAETMEGPVPVVVVSDEYSEGTHEIEGTIELRNRCQRLDASGMLDESMSPPIVRVDLTSEDDEGICLEIPEVRDFKVSVPGPEEAQIEVFVNGIPLSGTAL